MEEPVNGDDGGSDWGDIDTGNVFNSFVLGDEVEAWYGDGFMQQISSKLTQPTNCSPSDLLRVA